MSSFALNMELELSTVLRRRKRIEIVVAIVLVIVFTAVGFVFGYLVSKERKADNGPTIGPTEQLNMQSYHQMFQDEISSEKIEANLKFYTSEPHIAGSDRQHKLAISLSENWREFGFDEVDMPEYKVLLSVPQEEKPNKVEVVTNGTVEFTIVGKKKVSLEPKANVSFDYFPYYAYSPNGTVSGQLVYINKGYHDDFKELKKRNISVNGTIVIARGRFSSTMLAAFMGAKAALVFPDLNPDGTYPDTPWPSDDAVFERPQYRGIGDPLTPGIPSIDGMYRDPIDHRLFGKIPTQPISHRDAISLLSRLRGDEVPKTWKGGMHITLRFGPGFKNANSSVRVEVNNQLTSKSIFNVIGTVHGREEPDRYVLIGAHRDAWFFGAADPSSGTAALTEISRGVGRLLKAGWRPRRTIVFCSWGGEEFGLIGSVEWVEQNGKILEDRGVVYLNTDVAVGGNYVLISQNGPLLTEAIFSWAKKVKDPNAKDNGKSLYEVMVERNPSKRFPGEPGIVPYRFNSDYLPFVMHSGIPSADFSYFFGANTALYPVYHTQEDNFYWMKTFIDPHFKIHEAVVKFEGGLLIDLADTPLLPFDVARYPDMLLKSYLDIVPSMELKNISTKFVHKAILKFQNASKQFLQLRLNAKPETASPLVLRKLNDQMVQVEKAFISSSLKYSNNLIKHVFAYNDFPGVKYALRFGNLDEVKRQWSLVAEAISSAADILKPV